MAPPSTPAGASLALAAAALCAATVNAQRGLDTRWYSTQQPMLIFTHLEMDCDHIFSWVDPSSSCNCDMTINGANVYIESGYNSISDTLICDGCDEDGITAHFENGQLTMSGATTFRNYVHAMGQRVRFNSQSNNGVDRVVAYNFGTGLYLPHTRHFYKVLPCVGCNWVEAQAECARVEHDHFGLVGYLATLTSIEEHDVDRYLTLDNMWLGATDTGAEGTWKWVTGPEGLAGGCAEYNTSNSGPRRSMCDLDVNVNVEDACEGAECGVGLTVDFEVWSPGEPNNHMHAWPQTGEDFLKFKDGRWYDFPGWDGGASNTTLCEWGGVGTLCLNASDFSGAIRLWTGPNECLARSNVCTDQGQQCVDYSRAVDDWFCKCAAPLVSNDTSVMAALDICYFDECTDPTKRLTCERSLQECVDPDVLNLDTWECHCVDPAVTLELGERGPAWCWDDECADDRPDRLDCTWPSTCRDPNKNATSLGDSFCMLHECYSTCPTCANDTCNAHDAQDNVQDCRDHNIHEDSLGDWECFCLNLPGGPRDHPAPVHRGIVLGCWLDECNELLATYCTTCENNHCGRTPAQKCHDPDPTIESRRDWYCECNAPYMGREVANVADCELDYTSPLAYTAPEYLASPLAYADSPALKASPAFRESPAYLDSPAADADTPAFKSSPEYRESPHYKASPAADADTPAFKDSPEYHESPEFKASPAADAASPAFKDSPEYRESPHYKASPAADADTPAFKVSPEYRESPEFKASPAADADTPAFKLSPEYRESPHYKASPAADADTPAFKDSPEYRESPEFKASPAADAESPAFKESPEYRESPHYKASPAADADTPAFKASPEYRESPEFKASPAADAASPAFKDSPEYRESPHYKNSPAADVETPAFKDSPEYRESPAYLASPAGFVESPAFKASPAFSASPEYKVSPEYRASPEYKADTPPPDIPLPVGGGPAPVSTVDVQPPEDVTPQPTVTAVLRPVAPKPLTPVPTPASVPTLAPTPQPAMPTDPPATDVPATVAPATVSPPTDVPATVAPPTGEPVVVVRTEVPTTAAPQMAGDAGNTTAADGGETEVPQRASANVVAENAELAVPLLVIFPCLIIVVLVLVLLRCLRQRNRRAEEFVPDNRLGSPTSSRRCSWASTRCVVEQRPSLPGSIDDQVMPDSPLSGSGVLLHPCSKSDIPSEDVPSPPSEDGITPTHEAL